MARIQLIEAGDWRVAVAKLPGSAVALPDRAPAAGDVVRAHLELTVDLLTEEATRYATRLTSAESLVSPDAVVPRAREKPMTCYSATVREAAIFTATSIRGGARHDASDVTTRDCSQRKNALDVASERLDERDASA